MTTTRTTLAVNIHEVLQPKPEAEQAPDLFSAWRQPDQQDDRGNNRPLTVPERFEAFIGDNPKVMEHMVRIADEWIAETGSRRVGVNGLIEQVRWRVAVDTSDPEFKINNVFGPFFSRLIAFNRPDLADCFEYRKSIADEWIADYAARKAVEQQPGERAA